MIRQLKIDQELQGIIKIYPAVQWVMAYIRFLFNTKIICSLGASIDYISPDIINNNIISYLALYPRQQGWLISDKSLFVV